MCSLLTLTKQCKKRIFHAFIMGLGTKVFNELERFQVFMDYWVLREMTGRTQWALCQARWSRGSACIISKEKKDLPESPQRYKLETCPHRLHLPPSSVPGKGRAPQKLLRLMQGEKTVLQCVWALWYDALIKNQRWCLIVNEHHHLIITVRAVIITVKVQVPVDRSKPHPTTRSQHPDKN